MTEERYIRGYVPIDFTNECIADELRIACSANLYSNRGDSNRRRRIEVMIEVRDVGDNYEEGIM